MLTGVDATVGTLVARRDAVIVPHGKLGSTEDTGAGGRGLQCLQCLFENKKGGVLRVERIWRLLSHP